jgi:hypothetical protein
MATPEGTIAGSNAGSQRRRESWQKSTAFAVRIADFAAGTRLMGKA